ncbi:hypothetical protein [Arenibacterium sp. LLYu02]|uniref:hypothetical protein n=1 Tax=Arenibacterium sp. LLYu02 TaxID=3404132 RepID=UPI003B21E9D5
MSESFSLEDGACLISGQRSRSHCPTNRHRQMVARGKKAILSALLLCIAMLLRTFHLVLFVKSGISREVFAHENPA